MGSTTKPASELYEIQLVKHHIAESGRMVAAAAEGNYRDHVAYLLTSNHDHDDRPLAFDSPLEAIFWVWWMAARKVDMFCREAISLQRHVSVTAEGQSYVLDFVAQPVSEDVPDRKLYRARPWDPIGIELDGHAFHEKTLEQVTYRNQRDRALQASSWQIFHFSYSEFTARPEDCIWEVVECARDRYQESMRTSHA